MVYVLDILGVGVGYLWLCSRARLLGAARPEAAAGRLTKGLLRRGKLPYQTVLGQIQPVLQRRSWHLLLWLGLALLCEFDLHGLGQVATLLMLLAVVLVRVLANRLRGRGTFRAARLLRVEYVLVHACEIGPCCGGRGGLAFLRSGLVRLRVWVMIA